MNNDNIALVVTLYIEVLEKNEKTFRQHLDHHLKSDNWIKQAPLVHTYIKNNYIVENTKDFALSLQDFKTDMQALLAAPTNKDIIACTKTDAPMRGIAQLGNLGHVFFEVSFDKDSKKLTITCEPITSYGEEIDVFANFE